MEKVLSGKPVAAQIRQWTIDFIARERLSPKMLLIQIGEDPASEYYVQSIIRSGNKIGCKIDFCSKPSSTSHEELLNLINVANHDAGIHAIMIQKPLPSHIDENEVNCSIDPRKDIDGIHPENLGKTWLEMDAFVPCTAMAVIETMRYYQIDPAGKNVVLLGRSAVVGKPLAALLLGKNGYGNACLTVCHSRVPNLELHTLQADILISAIGRAEFVKASMIKENCILIDVGINEKINAEGSVSYVGDIDYNSCYDKALAITPVPGGIGSITTSLLLRNLSLAASGRALA